MPAHSSDRAFASSADSAVCRALLHGGSRSFFAASVLLPKSVRESAAALYAFCRIADDAIDFGIDKAAALQELRARLDGIYAGNPQNAPADRAFAELVWRFEIPKSLPLALLQGFEWDSVNRRYEDLSQLKAYGVRVAGTVGAMMAMVMNVRDPALIGRACDLGVAMQLTNIARDVGEDARSGRLYLPLDWMRAAKIEPDAWMLHPVFNDNLSIVIERLLRTAEVLYARSDAAISELPSACRPGMYAARLLYSEIGHELARRNFDSVNQRAVVPLSRKARILARAVVSAAGSATPAPEILEESRFLLDAIPTLRTEPAAVSPDLSRKRARWLRVEDRVAWLVDLFERLERRDRALG